ncbi:adenosine receptor A3-like [Anneissia japonica]|uniref:adenosine receptor A3-like n=1 Tax=Anneissia japonica TaxID=1529436 RepID=UPI00142574E6|nr:adenosine receptor A3-like [Anneissia japonica]
MKMTESFCNASFVDESPVGVVIVECIYISLLSVLGIFGNLFVITVVIYTKSLHNPHYFFLCNLSGFDLFTNGFLMPIFITTLIDVNVTAGFCEVIAYLRLWTVGMVLCTLSLMSFNRFMKVVLKKETYRRFTSKRWILLMIVSTGCITCPLPLTPLWGFGEVGFNVGLHHCTFTYSYDGWLLAVLLESVGLGVTVLLLFITNYVIFKTVRDSKRRVDLQSNSVNKNSFAFNIGTGTVRQKQKDNNKVASIMLAMIFTFMICWLPFSIAMFFNQNCTVPVPLLRFMDLLVWTNSTIDPFIYAYCNSQFLKAVKRLLPNWLNA